MYKHYIVGFMMIEGIVLELEVERIQLYLPCSQSRADQPSSQVSKIN